MKSQYNDKNAQLSSKIHIPTPDCSGTPIFISDETIEYRMDKVLQEMRRLELDALMIYADVEHGGNFEYLVGFIPRFEEALLVLHSDGSAFLVLGNENYNKAKYSRIPADAIHCPHFSLPNQPMEPAKTFSSILMETGIQKGMDVGLAGWKHFTSKVENNRDFFDIPSFIVDEVKEMIGNGGSLTNRTDLFIAGNHGARRVNNANEIAHYEFGASLASDCVLRAANKLDVGVSELELGSELNAYGQKNTVVTIASTGKRFEKGNLYPSAKKVTRGDAISLTVGYKGGLSSRAGYAVMDKSELPESKKNYVEDLAAPYFTAIVAWLENIRIGMSGGEMYDLVDRVLPREKYNWGLCPGHLTADEEWMSSPIYEGSDELIKSGMIFQTDIIPRVSGYDGVSAESTIVLADDQLKNEMKEQYPELWARMKKRKDYIKDVLGIQLSEDVLPMCSTVGYLRPYLLNKETAFYYDR
ncbi:Xaa-Pro aminopeptidase [Virgibacillus sp. MSP4-1]|uniref:M24 family metallopeptidase n=1 Tax=Virgibacillus sp. MSP4-1 TaxID=2700081 RepID=UPI0005C56D9B|nr:aminopeptidase P family protein [Virgibacillus sp. MSP4-1]QHS23430.1 Xaa-Pro aminopeptidase [Virgibacillus sp. MSP4-1]